MDRLRPRLLRTYAGPRGLARKTAGLRRVAPAAPWISPAANPRRYFSSSSASSSPASPRLDPDFLPPARPRGRKRRPPKENRAPPPSPLCRNVTRRQPPRRLRLRAPLGCSTPQKAPGTPRASPAGCQSPTSCCTHEALRASSGAPGHHALPELSWLDMDGDLQATAGSLELFTHEDAGSLPCKQVRLGAQGSAAPTQAFWSNGVPFQSHSAMPSAEVPLEGWGGLPASPDHAVSPQGEAGHLREEDRERSPKTWAPPATPLRPLQGAFQLQVSMCNGKVALSLPKQKQREALENKRQRMSVEAGVTTYKRGSGLNGVVSHQGSDFSLAESDPLLQPVVILDNQVVPNWLAIRDSGKPAMGLSQKKEYGLQPDSPCTIPGVSDTTSSSQVVPTCGEGAAGRKACISGFSSRRWGQQKHGQGRHKKDTRWQEQASTSLLQGHLKYNKMEDNLASSFLLDSSSLWRRMRASLSLHKKKKILSEGESFNGSTLNASSARCVPARTPKTPFTQKLGYSICPASSMVLLSSVNSFSIAEVTLTDAEKVYGECQQDGPISFEECIPLEKMQKCEKIGEGVFGEVFKTDGEKGPVALKIIPIEGSTKVNGEAQKTFREILPEIIISKELSLLTEEEDNQTSGFISLYSVHCVRGAYPEHLLKAWDEYDRLRQSENDRPDFFGDQQLFMVLEFEFGGPDLENMRNRQLNSVMAAKSILHQVTASLAVAEEALQFEHRDLHWGNVLVKQTTLKELSFKLRGESHTVPTQGLLVNIIDYTFSRLEKDGLTVYCDLSADEEVFQGRGDYQFDIYRQMREENVNSWADYFPHSNILWLHYLVDKLLKEVSYKKKPTSSSMKQVQKQLKLFSKQVLSFCSATELLNKSTFFH